MCINLSRSFGTHVKYVKLNTIFQRYLWIFIRYTNRYIFKRYFDVSFFLFTILATPRISSKIDEAEPRGSVKAANESQETRGKKMSERNSKKTGWEYRTVWQGALRAVLLITGAIEAPAYLAARGASRNRDAPPVFATHLTRERNGGTISRACKNVRTVRSCYSNTYGVFRQAWENLDQRTMETIASLNRIKMSIKYQQRSVRTAYHAQLRENVNELLFVDLQGWNWSKADRKKKVLFTFNFLRARFTNSNLQPIY